MSDGVRPGNLDDRLTCLAPGDGLTPLVDIQLRSPAQANAARYRTLAAFACPGQDQLTLEPRPNRPRW